MNVKISSGFSSALYKVFCVAVVVQVFSLEFSIAVSSIAFAVACVLYLALFFTDRERVFQKTDLEYYFAAYIVAVALMCTFAIYPADAIVNSRKVLLIAVMYFMPAVLKSDIHIRYFILALGIVTAIQSGIEIVLYYTHSFDRLGFFQIYMTSGGIKMFVLLLLAPGILWKKNAARDRIIGGACTSVILFALVLTETRSSWLGFIAGIIVIGAISYRYVLIAFVAAVTLFVLFVPGKIQERIRNMFQTQQVEQSSTIKSNVIRVHMWKTGWRMFLDHPVFGVGEGQVYDIYRTYTTPIHPDEGGHLHNNYIHLLATHGIVGLAVVLVLFAKIIWIEWNIFKKAMNALTSITALASLAAFTGFFINGMFEYNFGDHEILVLLWMTVGLAIAARRLKENTV